MVRRLKQLDAYHNKICVYVCVCVCVCVSKRMMCAYACAFKNTFSYSTSYQQCILMEIFAPKLNGKYYILLNIFNDDDKSQNIMDNA